MKKRKKQKSKSKSFADFVKHPFIRRNKPMLHTVEWLLILFAFFAVGFIIIYSQENPNYIVVGKKDSLRGEEISLQAIEEQEVFIGEVVAEPIDTTDWDTYQNKWYGFEVHHPDSWKNNTQYKTATEKSAHYETIYKFRKDGEENSIFVGYDVKIYPQKKVSGIAETNEVHKKNNLPENQSECEIPIEEIKINEDVTFQKVSIDEKNPCYEPAYFHSIAKGDYIYNIIPAVGESGERYKEPEKETSRLFPEYREAVDSFSLITIERPKPKVDPRTGVRKPVSAKVVNGKLVCAKKNDKPGKSKVNNKGKIHLDLECCLDPDEIPNPWCTYSSPKYQKYL